MKICLVSQEFPPDTARGGIGTQTWNKAKSLANLGHSVHVLSCGTGSGPGLKAESQGAVTVWRMPPPGQDGQEFPIYNSETYWLGYSWNVLRQLHRLAEKRFDVIDFPEYGAEGFAYQLDRVPWNWIPVVVQLHGSLAVLSKHMGWPEEDSEFYRVGTFMEGTSIKLADGLMACSANIADFTAGFYGIQRESIDIVHCGVDTVAFRPRAGEKTDGTRPTILFVGNIATNKGVETTYEAVLRLRHRYPNIRLQVLGKGDDELEQDLRKRSRDQEAESNVEFHGFVEHNGLPEFYRQADVFCAPSQYEVLGNVYLEAMACACPVVAGGAGGAAEAVVEGQTGILVPPLDVEAVTEAIDSLLSDASLRRRLGEAGRQRAENYFAMDKYIQRVLTVYENAIRRSQRRLRSLRDAEAATVDQPQ